METGLASTIDDGSSIVPVDWTSLQQELLLVYARLSLSDAVRSRLVRRPHPPSSGGTAHPSS